MDKVGGDIEINDSAGKDKAAGDAATSNEAAADKAVQDAVLGDAASGDKAGPSSVPTIDKAATSSVATSDAAIEDKAGPSMEKAAIGEAKGETAVSDTAASDQELRLELLREREKLVLWRQPVRTLYYFFIESFLLLLECGKKLLNNRKLFAVILCMITLLTASLTIAGPHQKFVMAFKKRFLWCSYWVGLGVLSSVGLGTGLHTFVLYLGPHIAAVTLAAFECMSVNFPEPPYPDDIICPETPAGATMSLWTIMSKVRLEAFMWGAGTAIGELPPYFMARASRLSGTAEEEDDLGDQTSQGPIERVKLIVQELVHRVGFLGIFICASIPNPLFDLAGITCGHFLVPFWTFFGATLIGKAVVKMHVQKLFVIFVFSERHVDGVIKLIGSLPHLGPSLQSPFKEYLTSQKHKLHRGRVRRVEGGKHGEGGESWLSWLFEKVVIVMVVYFIMSIINSLAQNYHKRLSEEKLKKSS